MHTSIRFDEFTEKQIKDLKKFYEIPEVLGTKFSTTRILIIAINYFWKHIFETEHELSEYAEEIKQNNR